MAMIVLSDLFIYPIKSAAGISVPTADLTARGLWGDRRYMVVDPAGQFMTQRRFPKMALIRPVVTSTVETSTVETSTVNEPAVPSLKVAAPGMDDLFVDPLNASQEQMVEVWGDRTPALSCGPTAQSWFSTFLGTPCQLVYMPESSHRPTDHGKLGPAEIVSFADAYPYLLLSEASLDGLNQKLIAKQADPVPMNRFRPNFVVTGDFAPHAEDQWKRIQMGEVTFSVSKPCARCSVPNVEQSSGKRTQEPSCTLATYRAWDKGIWFGQNLIQETSSPQSSPQSRPQSSPQALGSLSIGDVVKILD
ncbi:MAG: MOSC N-terminal beta barrel domain-containing protein [Cyanobacteria bacterium J06627_28]